MKRTGTKQEVYLGHAMHTPGGLTRADLTVNSRGKVVSAARSAAASQRAQAGGAVIGGARRRMPMREAMAGGVGLGTGILSGLLGSLF